MPQLYVDVKHVYVQKGCLDFNGVPAGSDGDVARPARIHSMVEISNDAFDIVRRHRAMFLDVCLYCGDEPRPHARKCSRFTLCNEAKYSCAEPRDEAAQFGLQRRRNDFPYALARWRAVSRELFGCRRGQRSLASRLSLPSARCISLCLLCSCHSCGRHAIGSSGSGQSLCLFFRWRCRAPACCVRGLGCR